jgi:hypothetical protein
MKSSSRCRGVAEIRDRRPLDQLHDEVGPSPGRSAAVENFGDVRIIHDRQGLPLGLEAGHHLLGVHSGLEDLQRHFAADRLGLFRHEDHAKAAFPDLLQQLVGADDLARAFADRLLVDRGDRGRSRLIQEAGRPDVRSQQCLDRGAQRRVAGACLLQIRRPLIGAPGQRLMEDFFFVHDSPWKRTVFASTLLCEKRRV